MCFFSIEETSDLGVFAGFTVLAMGSLGMAAPVQGGIGTYHALVSSILSLYEVAPEDGKYFAFLLHSSHSLAIIVLGGICLIAGLMYARFRTLKRIKSVV